MAKMMIRDRFARRASVSFIQYLLPKLQEPDTELVCN
jgi:hypothetical protein